MTVPAINQPPAAPAPKTYDVTIVTTRKLAQAKVMGVPPEEFGIERVARTLADCNYCFHEVVTKTAAQLVDEGFDKEQIDALTEYTGLNELETIERDTVQEHLAITGTSSVNAAARIVKVTEHYVRMDYKGTGRPCLYKVTTGGDQGDILKKDGKPDIEEFDAIPFAAITPIVQPHRFFGRAIADVILEIQRQKTAMKRGMLDNVYLRNNPRVEVSEANAGPNTLDDLLVSRPGGVVRTKTPGGLNWQTVPDVTTTIYPALQYLDAELETRTGLSKQTQGLDANALQNQSATAVAQVFSASQMRVKLIARVMAEGIRDMFGLLHGTIRKHGQQAATVRLRGRWVNVDPRNWKTRNDMTINVGLGSGGKAQQFAQTMAIGNVQKEMIAGGKVNLVGDRELYNTAAELTRIMGHKNPDKFFNDPTARDPQTGDLLHPPAPPQPSPEQIKAQSSIQIEQTKAQREAQNAQMAQQRDAEKVQLDLFQQKTKAETELQLGQEKLKMQKEMAILDAAIKERQDARAHEAHLLDMAHRREVHAQTMQSKTLDHQAKHKEAYPDHATADQVNQTAEHVKALHGALAEHAQALQQAANEPVIIVRDQKTGKAIGVQRGSRKLVVKRGSDGRVEGLQ